MRILLCSHCSLSTHCDHCLFLVSDLGLVPPRPEEEPPVPWWNANCDLSLLVAIVKHGERVRWWVVFLCYWFIVLVLGYEQFQLWRSDPSLCFKELVGEAIPKQRKSKKGKIGLQTPSKGSNLNVDGESEGDEDDFMEEDLDDGEDSEGDAASSTPSTPRPTTFAIRK